MTLVAVHRDESESGATDVRRTLRARSSVRVAANGRLSYLHSDPPLTIRPVMADRPGETALCLVGHGSRTVAW